MFILILSIILYAVSDSAQPRHYFPWFFDAIAWAQVRTLKPYLESEFKMTVRVGYCIGQAGDGIIGMYYWLKQAG